MSGPRERQAWIVLASVTGIAEELMGQLLARFGSAGEVLAAAGRGDLRRWNRLERREQGMRALPSSLLDRLAEVAADPQPILHAIDAAGLWTLTPLDAGYPARLRDLEPPPNLLHGWGDRSILAAERVVALVGTRRPTPAGRLLAARLASRMAETGAVVVSGLAIGIDGAAHAACVERGAPTVGIIGAGHGSPGPRAHAALRQGMLGAGGAIVSEHHPGVGATKGTYPRRNRIIAALAEAVLVVEAPARSGALITAHRALSLGRPVFVAPGRIGDWSVAGSLALLRETPARPLVGLDELIADLGYFALPLAAGAQSPPTRDGALAMLGPSERAVAQRLCVAPAGLDALVQETDLAPAAVSGAITLLLMRGWVQAVGPAYLPAGPLLG